MEQRLHAARRSVHLATRQAYVALISSNETIVMDPANDDPAIIHTNAEEEEEDDIDNDASNNNNNNTRAGMDLGLSLFGTSQSYRDQLEEEFDEQLGKVERELEDIRSGLTMLLDEDDEGCVAMNNRARSTMSGFNNAVSNDDDSYSDYGETMTEMLMDDNKTDFSQSSSQTNDVAKLQTHITFLQQCAKSRKLLDNVDTLSLTTNFATATSNSNSMSTPQNASVAFPYSPSSICSPSEFMRFTFDSVTAGGEGAAEGTTASPMVQAAQLVQQAEEILDQVMDTLNQECADEANNSGDQENNNGVTQMHAQMLNELQHQTRRKKMELRHRATTLVDGCIAVEDNRLLVRGGSSDSGNGSTGIGMGASPISASTPTNNNATPPSPLSDAYQVLQLFSNDTFPTFGETLDGTMKSLAQKLLSVIQPCLNELESKRKEQTKQQNVGYYKFTQETLRSARSAGGDRKYDPVSIKGPAVQLQWTLNSATVGANNDTAETDTPPITTATDLDEQTLSSSPLPSTATFLASLNFLSNFFSFVHTEVLLRRTDLAAMLGNHLFGTYPLSSQSTSIAAGSAFLSGSVLVGAAAQGVEEGEIRPLMTEMVRSMRKWCVPTKSGGEEVGGRLRRMEVCLIREVGAFEEKMAEIGMMNSADSTEAGGGRADVGTTGAMASSPTGLSLLLDSDGSVMDSPIHPTSATLSNLSSLDTTLTFPPKKTSQTTILSPLSQLAHSLRQAYVESQRSHILNLGRSILLNTDYHNTLREGTFVSDLAGCEDTNSATPLASLDKDRLSELFAFHECSISTTAKQILDLCRETLDDATDYTNDDHQHNEVDQLDSLPPMLYRTSRELLDLFRAIVPTLHASEVGSIPRTAAVLHNDCVFLAHQALLLGAEYKSKFQSLESSPSEGKDSKTKLLGEVCTFVDMVPPFRDLATKSMGSMIELQKGQLYELVSPRLSNFQQALASNESVTEWDDAETALRAALYHLRHLSQAWSKVLSRNVYHMSMGNLVDLVLTLFLDPVLKAEDITEVASRFVHSLFLDLGRGGADLFLVDDGGGGDEGAPSNNNQEMMSTENTMLQRRFQVAKKYSTLFSKSQAVGQFMTMRLGEIERGLEEGVFRSVTARELMHLIGAAFGEGEKRTVLLNALASR